MPQRQPPWTLLQVKIQNIPKETEDTQKDKIQVLDLKNTTTNVREENSLDGLHTTNDVLEES